jgi:hypothetical protein
MLGALAAVLLAGCGGGNRGANTNNASGTTSGAVTTDTTSMRTDTGMAGMGTDTSRMGGATTTRSDTGMRSTTGSDTGMRSTTGRSDTGVSKKAGGTRVSGARTDTTLKGAPGTQTGPRRGQPTNRSTTPVPGTRGDTLGYSGGERPSGQRTGRDTGAGQTRDTSR